MQKQHDMRRLWGTTPRTETDRKQTSAKVLRACRTTEENVERKRRERTVPLLLSTLCVCSSPLSLSLLSPLSLYHRRFFPVLGPFWAGFWLAWVGLGWAGLRLGGTWLGTVWQRGAPVWQRAEAGTSLARLFRGNAVCQGGEGVFFSRKWVCLSGTVWQRFREGRARCRVGGSLPTLNPARPPLNAVQKKRSRLYSRNKVGGYH